MPAVYPMRDPHRAGYPLGMTSNQQVGVTSKSQGRSAYSAWRIAGLATILSLLIEFGLGAGLNLYVSVPTHKAFFSTVFGEWALALHSVIALILILSALNVLFRSIRARRGFPIFWSVIGLLAIVAATGAGIGFVKQGDTASSMGMAITGTVALLAYVMVIFSV
jgi:hypothetical protein